MNNHWTMLSGVPDEAPGGGGKVCLRVRWTCKTRMQLTTFGKVLASAITCVRRLRPALALLLRGLQRALHARQLRQLDVQLP